MITQNISTVFSLWSSLYTINDGKLWPTATLAQITSLFFFQLQIIYGNHVSITCLVGGHPIGTVLTKNCTKSLFTCHQTHKRKKYYTLSPFSIHYVVHQPTDLIKLYICNTRQLMWTKKNSIPQLCTQKYQQMCSQHLGTINKSGSNRRLSHIMTHPETESIHWQENIYEAVVVQKTRFKKMKYIW